MADEIFNEPSRTSNWCPKPSDVSDVGGMCQAPTPTPNFHGHPKFYEIVEELKNLHSKKNFDYAHGGHPLGNFYRRGDLYARYPNLDLSDPCVVALVDAMKQLDAALWLLSNGHKAGVEGVQERLRDVAVYSILAMILNAEDRRSKKGK